MDLRRFGVQATMERCWILLGMMGAGKSSLGRALAERTGRTFLDTDQMIQNKLCRPIPQIFQIYGEDAFREHETGILKSLQPQSAVLATGGGIVQREDNWQELRRLGLTIYLKVPLDLIISRLSLSKKKRPLLQAEDWEQRVQDLLARRAPLYEQADLHVAVDKDGIDDAVDQILEAVRKRQ